MPAMTDIAHFASIEELLDYSWARDLQWPQVKNMAHLAGLDLSDEQFFQGYSDRQAKMEKDLPVASAADMAILGEHW